MTEKTVNSLKKLIMLLIIVGLSGFMAEPFHAAAEEKPKRERYYYQFGLEQDTDTERKVLVLNTTAVDYSTGKIREQTDVVGVPQNFGNDITMTFYEATDSSYDYMLNNHAYLLYFGANKSKDGKIIQSSLYSYHAQTKKLTKIYDYFYPNGFAHPRYRVYPSQGMYTMRTENNMLHVRNLKTNQHIKTLNFLHTMWLHSYKENWGSRTTPRMEEGETYYFDISKRPEYGTAQFKLALDGTTTPLYPAVPNYQKTSGVYERKVGTALFRETIVARNKVKAELIIPGRSNVVINDSNKFSWFYFSPKGTYVVVNTNLDRGMTLAVFSTKTGEQVSELWMPYKKGGTIGPSIMWMYENEDIVYAMGSGRKASFNLLYGDFVNEPFTGGTDTYERLSTFGFDANEVLIAEDPIPIKIFDTYLTFSRQGSFMSDYQIYVPLRDFVKGLNGRLDYTPEKITVHANQKAVVLKRDKLITWGDQSFYLVEDLAQSLGLSVKVTKDIKEPRIYREVLVSK